MTNMPAYFRQEAKRYRDIAAAETDPAVIDQLIGYAKEYEAWAAIVASEALRQQQNKEDK
jgi:hypothetical protein